MKQSLAMNATVINQAVFAILIVISVASWAIVLSKSLAVFEGRKRKAAKKR